VRSGAEVVGSKFGFQKERIMHSKHGARVEFFDRHAGSFRERDFSDEEKGKLEWFREQWDIRPGMTVVEPGCGDGRLTKRLADWVGKTGKVIAFDPSPGMIGAHRDEENAPNVERYVAAAEGVNLPEACADRIICACVFPHFDDKPRVLGNMRKMLREDGLLFVAHLASREELNRFHHETGDAVMADRIPPEDQMRRLFEDAGFGVDEIIDGPGLYHLRASCA